MTDQDMWKSAQYFNPLSLYRERRCFPRASIQRTRNFNPLSLYRERLQLLILQLFLFTFQSTLPIQGETLSVIRIFHHQPFQSTLPIQGETLLVIKTKLSFIFQSTLPIQGETSTSTTCSLYEKISIHSPYTGRDSNFAHKTPNIQPISYAKRQTKELFPTPTQQIITSLALISSISRCESPCIFMCTSHSH